MSQNAKDRMQSVKLHTQTITKPQELQQQQTQLIETREQLIDFSKMKNWHRTNQYVPKKFSVIQEN